MPLANKHREAFIYETKQYIRIHTYFNVTLFNFFFRIVNKINSYILRKNNIHTELLKKETNQNLKKYDGQFIIVADKLLLYIKSKSNKN